MVTDAQKKARDAWNRKNTKTLTTTMRNEDVDAFRAWCSDHNLTVSKALAEYVRQCIAGSNDD